MKKCEQEVLQHQLIHNLVEHITNLENEKKSQSELIECLEDIINGYRGENVHLLNKNKSQAELIECLETAQKHLSNTINNQTKEITELNKDLAYTLAKATENQPLIINGEIQLSEYALDFKKIIIRTGTATLKAILEDAITYNLVNISEYYYLHGCVDYIKYIMS